MGQHKDKERNDAQTTRIIEACVAAAKDPRIPLDIALDAEGGHPGNVKRLLADGITPASIARLLNYHYAYQTFAAVEKGARAYVLRLADGHNYTPNTVVWEGPR